MTDTVRSKRADAKRNYERLVSAARDTFAERGGDASMEEIAKVAGVGIGTLYRHFPKRIDVVEAVYRTDVDTLVEAANALSTHSDPWQGLESWLDAYVTYVEGKRTFLTELHAAFEKNPQLKVDARERIEGAAQVVLGRAQEAGKARLDVSAKDVMHLIGGMCMAAGSTPEQNRRLLVVVLAGLRP